MAHIEMNFYSDALKKNANVVVFLPTQDADDYLFGSGNAKYDPEKKYQTLYLLHGSYGDCMDWSRIANVERYAQEHCLAVVMPSGENSSYINMWRGENYLKYIGEELPEWLSTMFPLSTKKEDTFISGLSMGGYGCYRVGLEYPETFGAIAALSGGMEMNMLRTGDSKHMEKMDKNYQAATFGPDGVKGSGNDIVDIIKKHIENGVELPKMYMSCGTEDFIFPSNEVFFDSIKDLVSVKYEKFSGVHSWDYWDEHIKDVMNWLPLANGKVEG